ncbi:hypothetical protein CHUAL_004733 [Chamberlinius hualienensis]
MSLCGGLIREHKFPYLILAVTLVYFVAMDIALYCSIQEREPVIVINKPSYSDAQNNLHWESSSIESTVKLQSKNITEMKPIFQSFEIPDVKFIMLNHFNSYIITPLTDVFAKITHFNDIFFFVTPNMLSFLGVVMGVLSIRLLASQTRSVVMMGIVVLIVRDFFDALDGIAARSKKTNSAYGYYIDGIADTISMGAMLFGVYCHIQGSRTKEYIPVHSSSNQQLIEKNNGHNRRWLNSSNHVFNVVLRYACIMAISGSFWNIFILAYQDLLTGAPENQQKSNLQNAILQSSIMWLITLGWRLLNSFALANMLLVALFFGKAWEFLLRVQYTGFAVMLTLVSFTILHYRDASCF